jgi:hypothetical protein
VAVVLLLTVLAVATALTIGEPTYLQRLDYASGRDGCANVPMAPAVTPQTHPDSYRWPYGAVHACRVLDVVVPLFGEIDVSFNVLLETDTGLTVLRLEYLNVDAGRQYSVRGVELEPTGAGLSADEVARVRSAIADRGGLQPTPWIVTYGDG